MRGFHIHRLNQLWIQVWSHSHEGPAVARHPIPGTCVCMDFGAHGGSWSQFLVTPKRTHAQKSKHKDFAVSHSKLQII